MHRSVSRALRGPAVLLSLCFATSAIVGCQQQAAVLEDEASDDVPELSFGHDEIMESWTLDGDHYVSPRLEAPLGATRVGVLLGTLDPAEAMPELEARAADEGAPGAWTPVQNTWSEEGVHVGVADLAGGATAVQLRVEAALVDTIADVTFNAVIPAEPDALETDESGIEDADGEELGLASAELRSDLAALGVRTRAQWGARRTRCSSRDRSKYRFAIHHTVSPQTGNVPARIRGFQSYHMDSHGWCDIGYHFLVGADGTVYEGRPLELLGAHVLNNNSGNIGISFVGCFDGVCPASYGSRVPADRAIRAAARVMHRLSRVYGISISTRNVLGHRQHSGQSTSCPGTNLLNRLGTLRSLARSGAGGGSTSTPPPPPLRSPATVAVTWSRGSDRRYSFTANVPAVVTRVDYYVDGWRIGSVRRSAGSNFPARYRFSSETRNRRFEARGYNASGTIVARGYGLIEPVASTAVAIRQTGHATYEVSVERPPTGVRSIEVSVDDGFILRDSVSNSNRSTRMAVRYQFLGLRTRPFRIRMFNEAGMVVRTERRTFTLR